MTFVRAASDCPGVHATCLSQSCPVGDHADLLEVALWSASRLVLGPNFVQGPWYEVQMTQEEHLKEKTMVIAGLNRMRSLLPKR